MKVDSELLLFQHRVAGPLEMLAAAFALIFSSAERARYRRFARASALLRLSLNPDDGDDTGGSSHNVRASTRPRILGIVGLGVVALMGLLFWHLIQGPSTTSSSASSSCPDGPKSGPFHSSPKTAIVRPSAS